MRAIEVYVVVIVHLGAIPANLFPAFYSRSPWRSTAVGKALMLKGCALAALFDVSIAAYWCPWPGFAYFNAAAVTAVSLGIGYQFAVMRRLQIRGRDEHTPPGRF